MTAAREIEDEGPLLANDLVDAAFLDTLSLKGTHIHAECPYG